MVLAILKVQHPRPSIAEEFLSPVVQHKRIGPPGRRGSGITRGTMLFFASFSGGLLALLVGFIVLITGVGIYSVLIWPLTFWDLTNIGLERYATWTGTIVLSVFAGGAAAGYWTFSGGIGKPKQKAGPPRPIARSSR